MGTVYNSDLSTTQIIPAPHSTLPTSSLAVGGKCLLPHQVPPLLTNVRNVPDTSTTGAAAMEKRHSDLLDFYVAVSFFI